MSGKADNIFRALKTFGNTPTKIEVKRDGFFGPRKVIINGHKAHLKDLISKVKQQISDQHIRAQEKPEDIKALKNELKTLHNIVNITKKIDRQEKICLGLFSNIFGRSRQDELSGMSQHIASINNFVQSEMSRKLNTLELLLNVQEEPSLSSLKAMDIGTLAEDLPSIEKGLEAGIKDLTPANRVIVEKKVAIIKDRVNNFITHKTLSIILDSSALWNVNELRKMDMRMVADDFPMIEAAFKEAVEKMSPTERYIAEKKLNVMREMVQYTQLLRNDNYTGFAINEILIYRLELKNAGVTDVLPTSLTPANHPNAVNKGLIVDKKGIPFDHIRQQRDKKGAYIKGNSATDKFAAFCQKKGGDYGAIRKWFRGQAGDSWSPESRKFKNIFRSFRDVPEDKIWPGPSLGNKFELDSTDIERKTARMHLAFLAEAIAKIDFPGKNDDGTITVYRTESKVVLEMHNITTPSATVEHQMPHGFAESVSIMAPVLVYGDQLTERRVPLHRVVGAYFLERLLHDSEKELICMLDDIPFIYSQSLTPVTPPSTKTS